MIENENTDKSQSVIPLDVIPLDYAYSNVAQDIDKGIRDTINGMRLSVLAVSIGLAKINEKKMYLELNYRSMNKYVGQLCIETKMDRSSIYNWINIGQAYLKYRSDLEQIGFSDSDGPTKLPYIDRALEANPKPTVFSNIKKMSVREFKNFAKIEPEEKPEQKFKISVRDNVIYYGGRQAITISNKLDRRTHNYFKKVALTAGKAMQEGGIILTIPLRNMDEVQQFEKPIKRLVKKLRE